MTVYSYLRVSTEEQDYEKQQYGILQYCKYKGITVDKEYIDDGISGTIDFQKRELGKLIEVLKKDDEIIVSELSRISRSMIDINTLAKIFVDKGVKVFCIKENLEIGDTAIGLMVMNVFAFSAQIERERISERTKEALAKLKSDGIHLGRPFGFSYQKLVKHKKKIKKLLDKKVSKTEISKLMNCSWPTLQRFIKENYQ